MDVDLQEWLAHWRLSALAPALDELGAVHPVDLLDLDSEDVASLGLKKLELKRWHQALDDVRANAVAAPSPLKGSAATSPFRSSSGAADGGVAGDGDSAPPQSVPTEGKDGTGPHFTAPGSLNESTILGGADRTAHYLDHQNTAGSLLSDDSKASRSDNHANGENEGEGAGGENAAASFGMSLSGELDLESALAGHHHHNGGGGDQASSEPAEDAFLNPCALTGRFEDQATNESSSQDPNSAAPAGGGSEASDKPANEYAAEKERTKDEEEVSASEKSKEEAAEHGAATASVDGAAAATLPWSDVVQVKERGFLGLGDSWAERFLSFNAANKTLSAFASNPGSTSNTSPPLWQRPVLGAVSAGHLSSSGGAFSGQRPHRFNVEFTDGGALVALAASSEGKREEWLQRLGNTDLNTAEDGNAASSAEDSVKGNGNGDLTVGDSVLEVFDESTTAAVVPPSPLPPSSPAFAATSAPSSSTAVVPSSPSTGDSVVEVLSCDERELLCPTAQAIQQQEQQAPDQTHVYNGDLSAIAEASAESLDPLSASAVSDQRTSPVNPQPSPAEKGAAAAAAAANDHAAAEVSAGPAGLPGTTWACGVCKRDNAPGAKACGVCFTKRSYEGGRNSPLSPNSGASTLSSSSSSSVEDKTAPASAEGANDGQVSNEARHQGPAQGPDDDDGSEEPAPPEVVVLIVTDHPQLVPFGPVIEYNGRDAFELGACGTVVAPLDGRDPNSPLAQFFFQRYEQFHPSEQPAAIANTQQLFDQLLERSQEKQQQATRRPARQRSQPRRSSSGSSNNGSGEDELKAAFRRRSSASQGRAHSGSNSGGGSDNHSPETRRRLTLEALKEEEASSGSSHLTGVLQNLRKAPRPTPAKAERMLERSAHSLDDTSGGGGGDYVGSGSGQSNAAGLYARSSLRRSSVDNLLDDAAAADSANGEATSATDLWKEALLKKERKKREKLERKAAEAAAAEAAVAALEASALMSPGGSGDGVEPPATARKEITKGAVARAKLALMDAKKAEEEARMAAELKEARELKAAEAQRLAEEEAARLQAEAEEAALPELQRHMLRRQRAREAAMREEEARLAAAEAARQRAQAAAEAHAAALEAESLLQDELNESEASGRGNRRKSDKIKALQMSIAATSSSMDNDPFPGSGARSRKEKGASNKDVPTVFIASDDPRLVPFGPVIEYNGRDAFEIGAVGGVMALLDATGNQDDSANGSSSSSEDNGGGDEGFFVFNHLSAYGPEEREAAVENTTELVHRLQAAQEAARAAELPNPLAKYGAALTGSAQELLNQKADEAQRLAAMQAATAAHNDNAARGGAGGPSQGSKPATLGRRVSSGFKGKKKSVAEVISAVASGGGDMMSDVVDLSSEAVFQMKPDEKMADLCAALVSPTAAPIAVLKLRDCGLGDGAVQLLASQVLAHSSAKALMELDLSMNTAVKEDGALALAAALASNDTLQRLNLTGMPLLGKSERVLRGFVAMYDTNFTLEKIVWRLDHPLANTLARLMTRNNVLATKRREQQQQPQEGPPSSSSEVKGNASPLPELVPVAPSPTRKNDSNSLTSGSADLNVHDNASAAASPQNFSAEAITATVESGSSHRDVSRAERISKVRGAFDRPHRGSLSPPRQQLPPSPARRSALDPDPRPREPPRHSLRRPSPPSSSFRAGSGSPLRRENHSSSDQQQRSPPRPSGASKLAAQNTTTANGSNSHVHRAKSQWDGAFNDGRAGQTLHQPSEAKLTAKSEAKQLPDAKQSEAKQLLVKPEAKQAKQPQGGSGSPRGFRASEVHIGSTATTMSTARSHSSSSSSSSHAAADEDDDAGGGIDVSGMDPLAFLEAQHQRLEARRRKRQALLAGLDAAQDGASATAGGATTSMNGVPPVKGALPMPPTVAAAAREQARVAAMEAKATARSGAKGTGGSLSTAGTGELGTSGAGVEVAEKKQSGRHPQGAGNTAKLGGLPRDVTADGRPLERVSLRPLTPLQPFVAEAKDDSDLSPQSGHSNRSKNSRSGPSSPSDPVPSADLTAALTKLAQEQKRPKDDGAETDENGVVDVDVSLDDDHEAREDAELGEGDEEEEEDEEEVISTIFLVSDDPRLQSFGQVYCFNGRDTFKFGEEKTVQTTMDASEGGGGGEGVFFIYPEGAFTAEQLPQAREHTDFLVMHLEEVHTFQAMGAEGEVENDNNDHDDAGGGEEHGNNEEDNDDKGSPGSSPDNVSNPTTEHMADDKNNNNDDGGDKEDTSDIARDSKGGSNEESVALGEDVGASDDQDKVGTSPQVATDAEQDVKEDEAQEIARAVPSAAADEEGGVAAPSFACDEKEDHAENQEDELKGPSEAAASVDDTPTAAPPPLPSATSNDDDVSEDLPPLLPAAIAAAAAAAAAEAPSAQASAAPSSSSSDEPLNSTKVPTAAGDPTSPSSDANNINNVSDDDDSDAVSSLQGGLSPLLPNPATSNSPPSAGVSFGTMLSRIDCQPEEEDDDDENASKFTDNCSPRSAGPFQEQDVYPLSTSSNEDTPTGVANDAQQQQRSNGGSSGDTNNENRENMDLNSPDHSPRYPGSGPELTAAQCSPTLVSTDDMASPSASPTPHSVENEEEEKKPPSAPASPLKDWSLLGAGSVEAAAAEEMWQTWLEELGTAATEGNSENGAGRGSDSWWLRLQQPQDGSVGESLVRTHASHLLLSKGCPPSQRRRLWALWSGADELRRAHARKGEEGGEGATTMATTSDAHYPADYSSLYKADACPVGDAEDDAAVRERIAIDAEATCPDLYFFQHGGGNRALCRMATALHRLLALYAVNKTDKNEGQEQQESHPAVPGYDSGMTQLAAFVLLAFKESESSNKSSGQNEGSEREEEKDKKHQAAAAVDDSDAEAEEDAFWTLAATVMYRLAPYYSPGTASARLDADSAHLSALIASRAPAAASQLHALEFEWAPSLLQEWWRALFFDALPPYCALHLWDLALFFNSAQSTSEVLVWVASGIACSGSNGEALARSTSCQEAIVTLRTAALELKQLSDLEDTTSSSSSSSSGSGYALAGVTKRMESLSSTSGGVVNSR